jgi:transposase
MKPPELITASRAELDVLLALAKPVFTAAQYELLEAVLATFVFTMRGLQNAKTSIKRLRKMLFGTRTESRSRVLKELDAGAASAAAADTRTDISVGTDTDTATAQPTSGDAPVKPPAPQRPGHGRIGADAYRDAPVIELTVTEVRAGEVCPECLAGKVYDSPPRSIVKMVGQPPLMATVYKLQRLRCRLCDTIFTAALPAGVSAAPKYDPSCASMLALLRYGNGMPFYRLEGLQASLHTPVPDATQWDIVYKALPGPHAACKALIHEAAQAPLLYIDDTRAKILSLMAERSKLEAAGQTPESLAIQTTGIVAELAPQRKAVLFITGHKHAGKNLEEVLAQRAAELDAPIQMSDALACNFTGEFETIVAKCLTHARREVVDVFDHVPQQARRVIDAFAQVYVNNAHCRTESLSDLERLRYHQAHSQAVMDDLKKWIDEQFSQHQVEPNSGLGKALRYLLNHWEGLTLFLRKEGAPLDNNVCEQVLKKAISHRKNSMFFKTKRGAEVGDIYMSLINTCTACRVNPFEYLQALQIHVKQVLAQAALWLPWNYHEQLGAAPLAGPG